ncbi:MAG: TonB-dependent receptor, partial [Desulfatitalea sp.]|nr:TonB-dependent receptor [Desulfatitalea sp.]NNK01625.1 TonB-dependent receptor [Desulfatitalea sp.]
DEGLDRIYLYWLLSDRWSLSMEGLYEAFKQSIYDPDQFTTMRTPLTVGYYHPKGLSCKLISTYVNQEVIHQSNKENEDFWVLDASVNYRLPKRRGVITIGARNLLDQTFRYQDHYFDSEEPIIPSLIPERTIYCRIDISI